MSSLFPPGPAPTLEPAAGNHKSHPRQVRLCKTTTASKQNSKHSSQAIRSGGLNVKSKNVLNKVVNVCGKVVGERQEHLRQLYERRVVRKAGVIDCR